MKLERISNLPFSFNPYIFYYMLTFSDLIKMLRKEIGMTQQKFAESLEVSTVLIVMIENKSKEPSKKFVLKLAQKLQVHPATIMPFLVSNDGENLKVFSALEKKLLKIGEELQEKLLKKRAKLLIKST